MDQIVQDVLITLMMMNGCNDDVCFRNLRLRYESGPFLLQRRGYTRYSFLRSALFSQEHDTLMMMMMMMMMKAKVSGRKSTKL